MSQNHYYYLNQQPYYSEARPDQYQAALPQYSGGQGSYVYNTAPSYYVANGVVHGGVPPGSTGGASGYPQQVYVIARPEQRENQPVADQHQQLLPPQPEQQGSPKFQRMMPQLPAPQPVQHPTREPVQQSQAPEYPNPEQTQSYRQYSSGFNSYVSAPAKYTSAPASYTSPRQQQQLRPVMPAHTSHRRSSSLNGEVPTENTSGVGTSGVGSFEQLSANSLKEQSEFNPGYDHRRHFPGRKSQGYFGRGVYSNPAELNVMPGSQAPSGGPASGGAGLSITGSGANGVTKPHISVFETKASRPRRRMTKTIAEVKYPHNYPAHEVPQEMRVPTSLPGGTVVMPPLEEDIISKRYATGVDDRNFLTVLEYEVNGQAIIWDYYTGYVHLTGLWKAVGHSKADIVRLLDYSPELEPLIKRVRGGFLKIQGTWVPYDIARKLASRVCYYIRYALVPIFGPTFPSDCMQPDTPGFGMLQMYYPSNAFTSRTGMSSLAAIGVPAGSDQGEDREHAPKGDGLLRAPSQPPHEAPNFENQAAKHPASLPSLPSAPQSGASQVPSVPQPDAHRRVASVSQLINPKAEVRDSVPPSPPKSHSSSVTSIDAPTLRPRVNSTIGAAVPFRERLISEEAVFEDEEVDRFTPPPMPPRTVSFPEQDAQNASEILAMLNATRSLQQLRSGKLRKDTGGDFERCSQQIIHPVAPVDGKCHTPPTVPSPELKKATLTRRPTLTTILNS